MDCPRRRVQQEGEAAKMAGAQGTGQWLRHAPGSLGERVCAVGYERE